MKVYGKNVAKEKLSSKDKINKILPNKINQILSQKDRFH